MSQVFWRSGRLTKTFDVIHLGKPSKRANSKGAIIRCFSLKQTFVQDINQQSQSARSQFKQTPVNPSVLKYIEKIGVGKPSRTRRRRRPNSDSKRFLSFIEENEELDGNRRPQSKIPPPPFASSGSDYRTESGQAIKQLPVKLLSSIASLATPFPKSSPNLPEIAIAGRSNVGKSTLLNALLYGSRKKIEENEDPPLPLRRYTRKQKPTKWTAKLPRGLKAATSAKPGETRAISFYQLSAKVNSSKVSLMLVDLPGYGFAFASEEKATEWQSLMKAYIVGRGKSLKRILLLVDARHGIKRADVEFLESMQESKIESLKNGTGDDVNSSRPSRSKKSLELPPIQIVLTKCDLVSQADLARRVVLTQRQVSESLRRQPSALPVMLVSAQIDGQAGVLEVQKELAALAPQVKQQPQ